MLAFNSAGWFYMKRFADPCVPEHMGSEYLQPGIRGVGAYCTKEENTRWTVAWHYCSRLSFSIHFDGCCSYVFSLMWFCEGVTVTFG